jgi:hypothetical protein
MFGYFALAACETLAHLITGHAAKVSYLPADSMGDLRLYTPQLLRCRLVWMCADIEKFVTCAATFGELEDKPCGFVFGPGDDFATTRVSPYETRFIVFGIEYKLKVIARGDFTGNGVEDFVAELSFSPTGPGSGTGLKGDSLLILSRQAGQRAIAPVACYGPEGDCHFVELMKQSTITRRSP